MMTQLLLLLALVSLMSCQNKEETIIQHIAPVEETTDVTVVQTDPEMQALVDLLKVQRPNLALAQFIGESLGREEKTLWLKALRVSQRKKFMK